MPMPVEDSTGAQPPRTPLGMHLRVDGSPWVHRMARISYPLSPDNAINFETLTISIPYMYLYHQQQNACLKSGMTVAREPYLFGSDG